MPKFPSRIVKYGDKLLHKRASLLQQLPSDIRQLVSHMKKVMVENNGIGLAAPQIGLSQKVIVVQGPQKAMGFINPKIVRKSKHQETHEEGCLSVPGIFVPVKRASSIEVQCVTPDGKQVRIEAKGLVARIFQHEIDHIEGKLIVDHLSIKNRWKIRKVLQEISQKK